MIRLTGGEFRGRSIQTPLGDRTRPSQSKLRQALFNTIQFSIPESNVLDLFAGAGTLGFEALSRGASQVVSVESSRSALKLISANAEELGVNDRIRVIPEALEKAEPQIARYAPYDFVFADPPYAGGWEQKLLNQLAWDALLKPGGLFLLEWGTQKSKISELPTETSFLVKTREKNYGDSVLTTYSRRS